MNDSVDKLLSYDPELDLIQVGDNIGFAAANNLAMGIAVERGFDYVLLLNNDTVVSPDFLTRLVRFAQSNPNFGMLSSKIYFYQESNLIWFAGGYINWARGKTSHYKYGQKDSTSTTSIEFREVDYVTGCCLLVATSLIRKIGLLPECYFLYFEETEWNLRATRLGYKSAVVHSSHIWHKEGASQGGKGNFVFQYYFTRNRLLFMARNAPKRYIPIFILYLILDIGRVLTRQVCTRSWSQLAATIFALWDFVSGRTGKSERITIKTLG